MEQSAEFIKFLKKYDKIEDLIENLFIKSLIESKSRIIKIENIQDFSEPQIRNKFQYDLIYFNEIIRDILEKNFLTFTAERQIINKEKEIMRTDIEFIISGVIRFVIECKKIKGVSKSQYIGSGISRFVKDEYTNENDKFAGMCCFVIHEDIELIINGLKDRINQYNFLRFINNSICGFQNSFSSIHQKVNNNEIFIYHLFFDMNQNEDS
jgi:hypothetical protein